MRKRIHGTTPPHFRCRSWQQTDLKDGLVETLASDFGCVFQVLLIIQWPTLNLL